MMSWLAIGLILVTIGLLLITQRTRWRAGSGGTSAGLHPGVRCTLQGLQNESVQTFNGESVIIREETNASRRRELTEKGRFKATLCDVKHAERCLSVKAANLTRCSKVVDEQLDAAIRADVMQGEQPMPMSAEAIVGVLAEAPRGAKYHARVRCHRCWREGTAGAPYCCLEGPLETGEILLECVSCLVLAAAEAGITSSEVNGFVEDRNMGCAQAKAKLISDRWAYEDRPRTAATANGMESG